MMTIHNFSRGARGLRVIWLCEEMGLPYAVRNHPFPLPGDYRALNPLGTVPFLEDDPGVQSGAWNSTGQWAEFESTFHGPTKRPAGKVGTEPSRCRVSVQRGRPRLP